MGCFISLLKAKKPIPVATKTVGSRKPNDISSAGSERLEKDRDEVSRQNLTRKRSPQATTKLIAVIGRTGSGMSQFIHDVTNSYTEGVAPAVYMHHPYTPDFKAIRTRLESTCLQSPNEVTNLTLIDSPGFDYSRDNNEYTTLKSLATWLRRKYGLKVKLDGVIYMHNIWNEEIYHRSHGSKFLSSQELEQLCGPSWHRKIMLVNSHWSENIGDDGEDREKRLREDYWSFMIKKGSEMRRYESPGDHQCARDILKLFL